MFIQRVDSTISDVPPIVSERLIGCEDFHKMRLLAIDPS